MFTKLRLALAVVALTTAVAAPAATARPARSDCGTAYLVSPDGWYTETALPCGPVL